MWLIGLLTCLPLNYSLTPPLCPRSFFPHFSHSFLFVSLFLPCLLFLLTSSFPLCPYRVQALCPNGPSRQNHSYSSGQERGLSPWQHQLYRAEPERSQQTPLPYAGGSVQETERRCRAGELNLYCKMNTPTPQNTGYIQITQQNLYMEKYIAGLLELL